MKQCQQNRQKPSELTNFHPPAKKHTIPEQITLTKHKNKFAFPRAQRLLSSLERPILTHSIGYDIESDFTKTKRITGSTKASFGGTSRRFEYYSSQRKHSKMPSPVHYANNEMPTRFGKRSVGRGENQMLTFGTGRGNMQRLHVDAILYKGLLKESESNPGPGQHNVSHQWATPKDSSLSKTSPQFTFTRAPKGNNDHFNRQVSKGAAMPGPGAYSTPISVSVLEASKQRYNKTGNGSRRGFSQMQTLDSLYESTTVAGSIDVGAVIGRNSNNAMSKVGNSLTSTIRQDAGSTFSKARDRFYLPHQKRPSPPPTAYNLPETIGLVGRFGVAKRDSLPSGHGRTVFGKENRSREFEKLLAPKEKFSIPGPGQYAHNTEFDNASKEAQLHPSAGQYRTQQHTPREQSDDKGVQML